MTDSEAKEYIVKVIETLEDYFRADGWLYNQTHIEILARYLVSCSYRYPDRPGDQLFNDVNRAGASPCSLWQENARNISHTSSRIQGRKSPGTNDSYFCKDAISSLRALRTWIPDNWHGQTPIKDEEVSNICDRKVRYFKKDTGR